jgi:hypothetical protein
LRAGEIAHLTWAMITDPTGAIGTVLELPDAAAKKGSGWTIPLHEDLRAALAAWRAANNSDGPVIVSERGGPMTPQSIVVWFASAYRVIGLNGCSSHSGRRTFITRAARLVYRAGGSLRDVQLLAGHRSIHTTERYIDGDTDAQRKLVSLIGTSAPQSQPLLRKGFRLVSANSNRSSRLSSDSIFACLPRIRSPKKITKTNRTIKIYRNKQIRSALFPPGR